MSYLRSVQGVTALHMSFTSQRFSSLSTPNRCKLRKLNPSFLSRANHGSWFVSTCSIFKHTADDHICTHNLVGLRYLNCQYFSLWIFLAQLDHTVIPFNVWFSKKILIVIACDLFFTFQTCDLAANRYHWDTNTAKHMNYTRKNNGCYE